MAEPFLGEIRIMSFNFPPKGWAFCNGGMLPINQNQAIFSLLGTAFGGNGQTNFALPNLQGRTPIHTGTNRVVGVAGGETAHTVSISELPQHIHTVAGTTNFATGATPGGAVPAAIDTSVFPAAYADAGSLVAMAAQAVGIAGSSQPHENMQPYLTLSFCIALQGIFPSQT